MMNVKGLMTNLLFAFVETMEVYYELQRNDKYTRTNGK